MPLEKQIRNLKIAVLVPCYKRPEYTKKLIDRLNECEMVGATAFYLVDDGSKDGTSEILETLVHPHIVKVNEDNQGLRTVILDFFEDVQKDSFDIIGKIDNDQLPPLDFLPKMIDVFKHSPAEILSPNVYPSDAAHVHGRKDECGYGYLPTSHVGGLWFMKSDLINDVIFERLPRLQFLGAFPILKQIITIKEAIVGWVPDVVFDDVGYWTGDHPDHIKSPEHKEYHIEIERKTGW